MNDPQYLRHQQYRDATNLNARIQLHARFSTNHYGWHRWVYDQLALPPQGCILELGCGSAELWATNLQRVPAGCEIILSDFSAGMARQAMGRLAHGSHPSAFAVLDAQAIPFGDRRFDVVIANHMLYHVPDRERALAEIRRVLRPGGYLYATTIGQAHLLELYALVERFDPASTFRGTLSSPFTLESAPAQLAGHFAYHAVYRYEDALMVNEAVPLVNYIISGSSRPAEEQRTALTEFVERELAAHGGILRITKDSGMLVAC